jgi:hypothetical protein
MKADFLKCTYCGEVHKSSILRSFIPPGVEFIDLPLAKFSPEDIMGIPNNAGTSHVEGK